MINHYCLTQKEYDGLLESGITVADLINERHNFRFEELGLDKDKEYRVSSIVLEYYLEHNGFWGEGKPCKHKTIAEAVFNSMDDAGKAYMIKIMGDYCE